LKNQFKIISIAIVLLLFWSCIPQRKINYIQEKSPLDTIKAYITAQRSSNIIQPFDQLFINVSTMDERISKVFNINIQPGMNTTQSYDLISYTVSDSGNINLPLIGNIFVKGKSLEQAKEQIQLKLTEYIETPIVTVKFLNRSLYILGEVYRPGAITFPEEQINILQALAMAGDLTQYANRNKITLIREINNKATISYIDVTDRQLLESPNYYLRPDDILYIEPLSAKYWGVKASPPETFLTYITYITTLISFYLFFKSL
jgi:polysaccharide export outer membrane protein